MLRREEELRLCAETQFMFSKVRSDPEGVYKIVEDLQRRVAVEFGLSEESGIVALRSAERWLGEERARELSFYRRHRERCRDGSLQIGDIAPLAHIPLLPLVVESASCGNAARNGGLDLSRLASQRSPLVLIAGSHS